MFRLRLVSWRTEFRYNPLIMRKKSLVIGLVVVAVLLVAIVASMFFPAKPVSAIRGDIEIKIGDAKIIAEVAHTEAERERGLGGVSVLREREGMYFIFDEPVFPAFWMKDMKIPIDIVWISGGRVIGFEENVDPQIGVSELKLKLYKPKDFVNNVLELRAGAVKDLHINKGDEVITHSLSNSAQ